ncbi:hypothetical protein MmTuc01_2802 [Methanosarcina mazei Tuc01]|uniref:Uncharacterized protein n=1 Tax=Methanosarcina mazei Tuc01 TaxID=1236903 RepID=M1Q0I2_METMZ|nr:hypothetical protein MmTuc01_2802 [Methanosarcina mazei Tuc01]
MRKIAAAKRMIVLFISICYFSPLTQGVRSFSNKIQSGSLALMV